MTFLGAMFAQPLPWPGKLRLAGEEATLRADELRSGIVGRAWLSVEARVRRAYYDTLLAHELLELVEDRNRSWREISEIVRERYAVGIGVQQDVLRAQVEVLRLDEARADQNAQVANRRAELNRLLGRPQEAPIETDAETGASGQRSRSCPRCFARSASEARSSPHSLAESRPTSRGSS